MSIEDLLSQLQNDYLVLNPQVKTIQDLIEAKGETIVNDHIAFRTYNLPKVNIRVLAKTFIDLGYQPKDQYDFTEKKLNAQHFQHENEKLPKIFISELIVEKFSDKLQSIVKTIVDQIPEDLTKQWDFCASKRSWDISFEDYETLKKESEYAAWVSAFGFCANHFTIFVNELNQFESLQDLNNFLKDNDIKLNDSGGEIKGSPETYLEQSSSMAAEIEVKFTNGIKHIPSCYYEFARRYPLPNGNLFHGFIAKSADKIFESTQKKKT